jgi:hypothetical protein
VESALLAPIYLPLTRLAVGEKFMKIQFYFGCLVFLLSACTEKLMESDSRSPMPPILAPAEPPAPSARLDTRLAGAVVNPMAAQQVQGRVHFEQMPNSTISMYRLEGLQTGKYYQISVSPGPGCDVETSRPGVPVYQFKTSKNISESTFKIESFTVSAKNPLLGQSIVVGYLGNKKESPLQAIVACGAIDAMAAETFAPSVDVAPTTED